MEDDLEGRIDELYALPLEQFIAEREVLVKELRAAGRRDEAVRAAGLNKPSVAAWAVNQVVRSQAKAARALWEAGDAVLEVQSRVMAGEASGGDLRAAVDRERAALGPLADAARGLVSGNGRFLGDPNVQAVTETLHAAAVDPQAREVVAAGRAIRPLQVSGIGQAAPAAPVRAPAPAPAPATAAGKAASQKAKAEGPSPAARRLAERDRADATAEQERRRSERAERARKAEAQKALARAEKAREVARERVAQAARDRDAATARVEAAMRELGAAEDALGLAEQSLATGHEALEQAEGAVDAARAEVEGA
jgi:hypothetical protein